MLMVAFMFGSPLVEPPGAADDGADEAAEDPAEAGADDAAEEAADDAGATDDAALDAEDEPADGDDAAGAGADELDELVDDAAGVELPHAANAKPPTKIAAVSFMDFFMSTSMLGRRRALAWHPARTALDLSGPPKNAKTCSLRA
jgi:hypothetical protein